MSSRPLRQLTARVVDEEAMKGPVTRRQLAERIVRECPSDHFDFAEDFEWRIQGVMRGYVVPYMERPLSEQMESIMTDRLPPDVQAALGKMPTFICISPRGGAGAQHVMLWQATAQHLRANLELKEFVRERAQESEDDTRDWLKLIIETNSETFGEAIQKLAASLPA